jgi:DNA-directed RNA polymerase subunit beta
MKKDNLTQKRLFWGKIYRHLPKLDLLEFQKESYDSFLVQGIAQVLAEFSPIDDFTGKNWRLELLKHRFGNPKNSPYQAIEKGANYEAPLRVLTRLTNKRTQETIEQEVFLGDIPQMTHVGTFIINGIERAVVTQLVRSPGVFFSGETDPLTGRMLYKAELRPLRGSWLEFLVSRNDVISVRIDRHRKFPITVFLRAIGISSNEELEKVFKSSQDDKKHKFFEATLAKDNTKTQEEALIELYEKMRPGEPAILENARQFLQNMFFNHRRYDLGDIGRYKLNKRLGLSLDEEKEENWVLKKEDVVGTVIYLIGLQNGVGRVDDIDHLANRRVRRVGELVSSMAFRIGMLRLERSIREKMSLTKADNIVTPSFFINPRPMVAAISEFFRRNRLSTILDQTNPLSEIDNLRRLSVMGRGGVTRERASFSMRDINSSQYSRICPVRSPEGPNIGLVTYLSLYTRVNKYGFLEAPYRKVEKVSRAGKVKMKVLDEIVYLSADDEEEHYITHASINIDKNDFITDNWVPVRYRGEFLEASSDQIEYIDVIPQQVVGTSASLIPFLAHDEANRALMGTHMQCQAVPLVKPQAPIVGTGMEQTVALSMNRVVKSDFEGRVIWVDAEKVVIKVERAEKKRLVEEKKKFSEAIEVSGDKVTYKVLKFKRSAQSTCYSQRPIVVMSQRIHKGQIIIDGPAAENGELALGRNLLIAYMPFEGLGYEDAIVISDRLVKEDILSSIHINEYEAAVMDTKLGPEELTRDIPNVSETDLANLAVDGIVVVGANVGPNDILVGKIAPKGETELTAEERLLRAIFGEKAREIRDTSLRMPHGEQGTVIKVSILDREKGDELEPGVNKIIKVWVAQLRKVVVGDKLAGRHGNKGVISRIVPVADMPYLKDGTPVDIVISPLSVLARMNLGQLLEAHLGWAANKLGFKVAVPVFEKLPEENIKQQLVKAGLPTNGKIQLYDGKTGEPYEQQTTVGIAYILKLVHMVEDKTHARSTGPYSLVTQQPLGGKAQMGGQRLGEMEVWALEAHRAAHTLQEMLTIKSDDVVGRAKAFEAIVKGVEIPEATIPESFKVLVKELNSLSLNIIPGGVITAQPKMGTQDDQRQNQNQTTNNQQTKLKEEKDKKDE